MAWLDEISVIIDNHIAELEKSGHSTADAIDETKEDVRCSLESL